MSFEDDMIEEGFRDEQDYLDYICDQSDKKYLKWQDYDDEGELEYQRELHEEKIERRKELKRIYNQFANWRTNFPHEIDIWEGDNRNIEIVNEYSPKLEIWQKWKMDREKEDKLIEEAKPQLPIIKELIDIDAISWGFNQFLHDKNVWYLCQIINEWKVSNQRFIKEFYLFNIDNWSEYAFYLQKDEDHKKKVLRSGSNPNKDKILNVERDIADIRRMELWVKSDHFLDWDTWARSNTNWAKYVRNGYANMYQEVWWRKHESEKKYWECEDKAIPEGYNYNPEFKRRLIIKKLKHLHYSGGSIFNDNLAIFEDYDKYGFIDIKGNIIIDALFDEAREFHNGLAAVKVNAVEFEEYIPNISNHLTFKYGGQWGFINTKGTFTIQPQYDILTPFKNGIAAYCKGAVLKEFRNTYIPDGGKWGIISKEGKELIPPTYDFIRLIERGIPIANIGGLRDMDNGSFHDGSWCILSKDGNELTPFKYTWIFDYENGKAIVNVGGIREEFDGITTYWNGEWGYVDEKGWEIEPLKEYCNIDEFKEDWENYH